MHVCFIVKKLIRFEDSVTVLHRYHNKRKNSQKQFLMGLDSKHGINIARKCVSGPLFSAGNTAINCLKSKFFYVALS